MGQLDNDFDLDDLGLDLGDEDLGDLGDMGELDQFSQGVILQEPVEFIDLGDDDLFGDEEFLLENASIERKVLEIASQQTHDPLLLDLGDFDIGDIGPIEDTPKYEVMLSPAETVLQLYQPPENHSFLIEQSNKEIHDIIFNPGQYADQANAKIKEFLDSDRMSILPKRVNFSSPVFRKQQNFHSLLTSEFHNYRATQGDYSVENILDKVIQAHQAEMPTVLLNKERLTQIITAVQDFVIYADAVFDEAQRKTELVEYKMSDKIIECPQIVGNFVYVCKCDAELPMGNGRPTMTFLLQGTHSNPTTVALLNPTIYCKDCNVHLALPTPLVNTITDNMFNYVKSLDGVTFENPRIYRPKIEDLMEMIPTDAHQLFQLEGKDTVTAQSSKNKSDEESYLVYKKLIDMWMNSEVSEMKLTKVVESYNDKPHLKEVVKEISAVDFSFIPSLYSYQFTKTVIHYLEGFSCFAITKNGLASYKYYDIEGYGRKTFPAEFAQQWIYDNAPFLASLNNIFTGDTKLTNLHILPEYVDAINYVLGLHLLSDRKLLEPGSDLAKWIKNPSGTNKLLAKVYKKMNPPDKYRLVSSKRDLRVSDKLYQQECWSDAYAFFREVVGPNRYSPDLTDELKHLATQAMRKTESEFYGVQFPENMYIRPSLMFEEFTMAFEQFGYLLFTGPLVDEERKNLAKAIQLLSKANLLGGVFKSHEKPVNDVSTILVKEDEDDDVDINTLILEAILRRSDLPGDLNDIRDEFGYKNILENFEGELVDRFLSDEKAMEKYGEVINCYLSANTTQR